MKVKKSICKDIHKILKDKEIPGDIISLVLTRLANYTYDSMLCGKPATEKLNRNESEIAHDGHSIS